MLKKIFFGALIAISTFGFFSISEAHHNNYDYRDDHHNKNLCCTNFYSRGNSQNYDDCCEYGEEYCCR